MAYDQHTADVERELETTHALLAESERMRDSLRLQVVGAEHVRQKDNEYLLGEIERLHRRIKNMAADVNERLDWILRDRSEQDKVLANVSTARSVLIRYVLLSPASRDSLVPKEGTDG